MSYYTPSPKFATEIVARKGYSGVAGVTEIGTGVKNVLTGAIDIFGHALNVVSPQQQTVVQQDSTPSWLLPVGLAAVGITALVLLRKK